MSGFTFYDHTTAEYAADFAVLLRCLGGRDDLDAFVARVLAPYERGAVVVDWGAGSGAMTRRLLRRFDAVHAVEPSAYQRQLLARDCPGAHIVAGTIHDADVPGPIDVAFLRHVLYHVPEYKWGAYVLQAARRLSPRGVLVVTLKRPDSGCNVLLDAFGARRFDLFTLNEELSRAPEYQVEWVSVPAPIVTRSFEETCAIARFMLNDRPADAFARPVTSEAFEAYVRRHLWDEDCGAGGWRCDDLHCLVRPNPFWR